MLYQYAVYPLATTPVLIEYVCSPGGGKSMNDVGPLYEAPEFAPMRHDCIDVPFNTRLAPAPLLGDAPNCEFSEVSGTSITITGRPVVDS